MMVFDTLPIWQIYLAPICLEYIPLIYSIRTPEVVYLHNIAHSDKKTTEKKEKKKQRRM